MIFAAQPGYRALFWHLGEDGTENPPPILDFHEYPILAWRTTKEGLIPVTTGEIGSRDGLHEVPDGQWATIDPDGGMICGDGLTGAGLESYKHHLQQEFDAGSFFFWNAREQASYIERSPAAARRKAAQDAGLRKAIIESEAREAAKPKPVTAGQIDMKALLASMRPA
jgi:hypothetical protein